MGNIYTRDIKRIGQEILELYKDKVTTDYEKNKELVRQVVEVYSKKVRNRIAGYITRKAKQAKRAAEVPEDQEVFEE
ncbi:30S ribosomal protein S17e [Metallosphaera hakonensis]|uniref:Small ribosomal subunit protein eS17 n=1 Tax=Metallosphaera hakonensis JCM 8857 = DSM 7519 TaxID=1293036 RepID=A0A2U9IUB8_9CREN|nr:30S ribosomal protein S17e [Metallosphaera hakonensis]AWR99447.1 30S ribosomal protein S17e [Metallosphaera hakonensis JCM 8857 = DSM 7519]